MSTVGDITSAVVKFQLSLSLRLTIHVLIFVSMLIGFIVQGFLLVTYRAGDAEHALWSAILW